MAENMLDQLNRVLAQDLAQEAKPVPPKEEPHKQPLKLVEGDRFDNEMPTPQEAIEKNIKTLRERLKKSDKLEVSGIPDKIDQAKKQNDPTEW